MWLPFPSRGRKHSPPIPNTLVAPGSSTLLDLLSTSLVGLKQSADALPPLKSAVGGVLALWDIAERAKHSKSAAHDVALRTTKILHVIADAVPKPAEIPLPMLLSIKRFTVLLDKIKSPMEAISTGGGVSRIIHLNRNERMLRSIRAELDEAYRDFVAASALRVEVQQTVISAQQEDLAAQQTHFGVRQKRLEAQQNELLIHQTLLGAQQAQLVVQQIEQAERHIGTDISFHKTAAVTDAIALDLSSVLFYSRLCFFGQPLT
ncbi:hypothetical protein B0H14DRAFT_2757965 [Mycena olivaceomarginata]|nr:hypothetical protein B0H14DRAFT_2757965 [Mycena olivaceomarginata]